MKCLICILFCFCCISLRCQYYTPATLTTVEAARNCFEGDMYLDTINEEYKIGLSHGKLGLLTDDQKLDSVVLINDSIRVYLENGNSASVDVTALKVKGALVGDIKSGIQATDHKGWYIMDGRVLTALPAVAQTNAATMGIAGNLPDASNKVMKTKTGAEALLSTGGTASYTLIQANLPTYNLPAATTSSGDGVHTHTSTIDSAGKHNHTAQGKSISKVLKNFSSSASNTDSALIQGGSTPFKTDFNGMHIHDVDVSSAGDHNHTMTTNSGGSDSSFDLYQPYFVIRRFIYLGQ